jgi:hypothetical protein
MVSADLSQGTKRSGVTEVHNPPRPTEFSRRSLTSGACAKRPTAGQSETIVGAIGCEPETEQSVREHNIDNK